MLNFSVDIKVRYNITERQIEVWFNDEMVGFVEHDTWSTWFSKEDFDWATDEAPIEEPEADKTDDESDEPEPEGEESDDEDPAEEDES